VENKCFGELSEKKIKTERVIMISERNEDVNRNELA
jgi:hypothetical protein